VTEERRRASARTIAPGRLYQRGHFLTWPRAQKWSLIEELGIRTVVNLWVKVDPDLSNDKGLLYINWPIPGDRIPPDVDLMVPWLAKLLDRGPMLVQCEAGVNRSMWLCGRLLVARGVRPGEALGTVLEGGRIKSVFQADIMQGATDNE
jgi:protein-tyrosine phosphatase